ncbi:MAG TPA: hypothetical protein GXZ51_03705 [Acholeplasma sp.]|nr:hypothetical protein [Acholeplasma sp.]
MSILESIKLAEKKAEDLRVKARLDLELKEQDTKAEIDKEVLKIEEETKVKIDALNKATDDAILKLNEDLKLQVKEDAKLITQKASLNKSKATTFILNEVLAR